MAFDPAPRAGGQSETLGARPGHRKRAVGGAGYGQYL